MPHSVALQNQFGEDLQVVFVESQGHTIQEAEQLALKQKWASDHAIWTAEAPFETGASTIPHTVLLGNDGTVLYNGSPAPAVDDLIAEQIKLAKKGSKELPAGSLAALQTFEKGNFGAALAALGTLKDGAEKDAAATLATSLQARATAKLHRLDWMIENGDFDEADKFAGQLQKGFAGSEELLKKLKESADKLTAKELAPEREASKAFGKIEKNLAKNGPDAAALKQLKGFSEKFPNTRAAKRAAHLATVIEG